MSLNGIDVASYQSDMNVGEVAGDFALVKATEGVDYTNPAFSRHAKQTLSAGKKLGVYHFIRSDSDIKQQANYFLTTVKSYIGKAMLVLDFENTTGSTIQNQAGVGLAKQWLDYVYQKTGVRAVLYTGLSCENALDWSSVVKANYGLWIAQYNNYDAVIGYQPRDLYGSLKNWKTAVMFQYTSTGRLPGWNGNLDFDVFYGDKSAWDKYAKATKMVTNKSIVQKTTTKDGVWTITNEVGTFRPNQKLSIFKYPGLELTGKYYDKGESVKYFGYVSNPQAGYVYIAYRYNSKLIYYVACREIATGRALGTFE
ncbi:GH25 family lysozyme [Lactiplantibacillus plantarum]|uniref:GH25 family lysozyme n=1 Tax=Lactiplantibacillus plantarum TaxID=1590 RepID=UPI00293C270C|nr:GH25 family lysozyme [Lactiplantibacillus plantarum]MDV3525994.1 GH25 family lysozyme [Lactiplantibacillus plantarum]